MAYLDEGDDINDYEDYGQNDHNITLAITSISDWLQGKPGYKDSYVYQTIMSGARMRTEA